MGWGGGGGGGGGGWEGWVSNRYADLKHSVDSIFPWIRKAIQFKKKKSTKFLKSA